MFQNVGFKINGQNLIGLAMLDDKMIIAQTPQQRQNWLDRE